jgi:hypothetical protein
VSWEKIQFIKALDSLVDYHNLVRQKLMDTPPPTPHKNRFVAFLETVGHDFKVGLTKVIPIAATAGEVAARIFLPPGASNLFNQTVAAVVTAEQNAAAIRQQNGTGAQKLAAVVSLMGGLIKQALADMGKQSDDAAVEKYVSAVVTVLNAVPVPVSDSLPAAPAPPPAPHAEAPASTAIAAGNVAAPVDVAEVTAIAGFLRKE